MNEEAIAHVGQQRHKKKTNVWNFSFISASTPHPDAPSKSAVLSNVPVNVTKNLSATFVSSLVSLGRLLYYVEARPFCL